MMSDIITNEVLEEWKIFPDNENYLVSNKGFIKNIKTQKVFEGSFDKISGYMRTAINKKSYSIHYIVAKTFLPNPYNKTTVNHKNKNRIDNRAENLEWATSAEQNQHKNQKDIKEYTSHNNGKVILRLNKETNEIIEKYDSLMLAAKWINENVYNEDISHEYIEKRLRDLSASLSGKIKRSNNHYLGYNNFIWKFEEKNIIYKDEIWQPIKNIEKEGYYISNYGRVENPLKKIKDTFSKTGGYYEIKIVTNGQHHKIHRLVALAYIPNPENKPFVNHINGDKLDNRVENLEWVTNQENVIHAYQNCLNVNGLSPIIQYDKEGKNIIQEFDSISEASKKLNIGSSSISACCRGIILQTKGFHFKYKNDINKQIREKKSNFTCGKKIYQYDKNSNLIKVFNTLKECSEFFGVKRLIIKNKINGLISKNKEIDNFIFKFN